MVREGTMATKQQSHKKLLTSTDWIWTPPEKGSSCTPTLVFCWGKLFSSAEQIAEGTSVASASELGASLAKAREFAHFLRGAGVGEDSHGLRGDGEGRGGGGLMRGLTGRFGGVMPGVGVGVSLETGGEGGGGMSGVELSGIGAGGGGRQVRANEREKDRRVVCECGGANVPGKNGIGGMALPSLSGVSAIFDQLFDAPIRQVAVGSSHLILLGAGGEVWACGSNQRGQCGVVVAREVEGSSVGAEEEGERESTCLDIEVREYVSSPELVLGGRGRKSSVSGQRRHLPWVSALEGLEESEREEVRERTGLDLRVGSLRVKEIAAGAFHSVALTDAGEIFLWGSREVAGVASSFVSEDRPAENPKEKEDNRERSPPVSGQTEGGDLVDGLGFVCQSNGVSRLRANLRGRDENENKAGAVEEQEGDGQRQEGVEGEFEVAFGEREMAKRMRESAWAELDRVANAVVRKSVLSASAASTRDGKNEDALRSSSPFFDLMKMEESGGGRDQRTTDLPPSLQDDVVFPAALRVRSNKREKDKKEAEAASKKRTAGKGPRRLLSAVGQGGSVRQGGGWKVDEESFERFTAIGSRDRQVFCAAESGNLYAWGLVCGLVALHEPTLLHCFRDPGPNPSSLLPSGRRGVSPSVDTDSSPERRQQMKGEKERGRQEGMEGEAAVSFSFSGDKGGRGHRGEVHGERDRVPSREGEGEAEHGMGPESQPYGITQLAVGGHFVAVLDSLGALWVLGDDSFSETGGGGRRALGSSARAVGEGRRASRKGERRAGGRGRNADTAGLPHPQTHSGHADIPPTAAVSLRGTLLDGLSPFKLKSTGVKRIAAGKRHGLLIRDDGRMMAWGANGSGQCGVGGEGGVTELEAWRAPRRQTQRREVIGRPERLPMLTAQRARLRARDVAAGETHSASVSDDGRLFMWGKGGDGRLCLAGGQWKEGLGVPEQEGGGVQPGTAIASTLEEGCFRPRLIHSLLHMKVAAVGLGDECTVVVCGDGGGSKCSPGAQSADEGGGSSEGSASAGRRRESKHV
uniref:Uncharacterized protein n=1 Tax=Chromera velia CCMP2878 TaxID=1169474 RepID=A0A0G4HCD5_9ALVE|eukprot:Cvel_26082.t1-p1 / transcript=Cvel_26082.t1 / gene=Cvel_26082 / organism=Chromera_velia_CCMP2878 / gene_product=hypothetical protein / transcript_product=hypothetical protein / location=Cvel_scaffold3046:5156-12996(-) / protein_length=1032 / sequence_SO=supercontig / SO=protein_coding / is_pseudo=false